MALCQLVKENANKYIFIKFSFFFFYNHLLSFLSLHSTAIFVIVKESMTSY